MTAWHEGNTANPENPDEDGKDNHNADVERFRQIFLDTFELQCDAADKDDKEDNVEE